MGEFISKPSVVPYILSKRSIKAIMIKLGYQICESYLNLQIVRYGIIGLISTAIHASVAYCFIYFIGDFFVLSNIVGFSVAYLFSYTMQAKFVFAGCVSFISGVKYLFVQVVALFLAIALSNMLGAVNVYLKILVVVLILPVITFFIHKMWTFSRNV